MVTVTPCCAEHLGDTKTTCDYRKFPYARIATPFNPKDAHVTAILWDGSPQANGKRIVALDSGQIRFVPEAEFAAFLEAHAR